MVVRYACRLCQGWMMGWLEHGQCCQVLHASDVGGGAVATARIG